MSARRNADRRPNGAAPLATASAAPATSSRSALLPSPRVSPADEPSTVVLLMHSPSVGPATWQGVADRLRDTGVDVRVPSFSGVCDGPAPYWPQVMQRAVDAVGDDPALSSSSPTATRGCSCLSLW